MKTIKTLTVAFLVATLLGATSLAQAQLFPTATGKVLVRPEKSTKSVALNTFVTQSFDLHEKVLAARMTLENIHTTMADGNLDELLDLISKFEKTVSEIQGFAPLGEALISSSSNLFERAKVEISLLQIPLALKNFSAATKVLIATGNDLKFIMTTTIPGLRKLFEAKKAFTAAGTSSPA